jgi:hypothetical protein
MSYGYSYNTAGVPHITSFAQAKQRYEQTKPIKGSANVRPLGIRRHHKMASISMPNADTVNLEHCGKPLVQWRSDNTYTVHRPAYASAYTPGNTSQYVPEGIFGWRHGEIFVALKNAKEYFIPEGEKLEFQVAGKHHLLLNKPVAYATRANRNMAMKIMTKYQPFMDWLQVVAGVKREIDMDEAQEACDRLRRIAGVPSREAYDIAVNKLQYQDQDDVSRNYMWALYDDRRNAEHLPFRGASSRHMYTHFHRPSCELLDSWLTDTNAENWVQAMYVIARHQGRHLHFRDVGGAYKHTKTILPIDKAVDFLKAMTSFVHSDEVFTRERLPDGQLPTKANLNFFHEIHLRNLGTIDSVSMIPN